MTNTVVQLNPAPEGSRRKHGAGRPPRKPRPGRVPKRAPNGKPMKAVTKRQREAAIRALAPLEERATWQLHHLRECQERADAGDPHALAQLRAPLNAELGTQLTPGWWQFGRRIRRWLARQAL